MADDADMAGERSDVELARLIASSRAQVPPEPDLGCKGCMGITHKVAKETCIDFSGCLKDWQRLERLKKIIGSVRDE
jgi:hypothetical protein